MLLAEHGAKGPPAVPAKRLDSTHVPQAPQKTTPVVLDSISDVSDANRLAKGQTLAFAPSGLTAIYGGNGAGKSGYVRMLKQVCRARAADAVLPDVFASTALKSPSAIIKYSPNGSASTTPFTWVDGNPGPDALSQISVFDTKVATITLSEGNELTFLPMGLDALEKLAKLGQELELLLKDEETKVQSEIDTAMRALSFPQVTHKSTDIELERMCQWSEEDEAKRAEVGAKLNDPLAAAAAWRKRRDFCRAILNEVFRALDLLSDEAVSELRRLCISQQTAEKALAAQSMLDFREEPLPGIGGDAWKLLYDAARKFSLGVAYPGREFPAADPGDVCVLCLQPLNDAARDRLRRFEQFVRAELAGNLRNATQALISAKAPLEALKLDEVRTSLDGLSMDDALWAGRATLIINALSARLAAVRAACDRGSWDALPELAPYDRVEASSYCERLENQAQSCDAALKEDVKAQLSSEMKTLQERSALKGKELVLKKLRDDLLEVTHLKKARADLNPRSITTKKKALENEYINTALQGCLDEERDALQLTDVAVSLKFTTRNARTSHQLQLDGADNRVNVEKVVSEGEYRALALACFLAQVRHQSPSSGIILDDPVSSLDHDRRELVAKRLVKEAKQRQVIVFTHDLVFYSQLTRNAENSGTSLERVSISRGPEGFGTVDGILPEVARKFKERVHFFESTRLPQLRKLHEARSPEYDFQMTSACGELRKAWERLVEEGLLNGTITRFEPSVQTLRLDAVIFDEEALDLIHQNMTELSRWSGHDRSESENPPTPTPDQFEGRIQEMRKCWDLVAHDTHRRNAKERRKNRRALPAMVTA
ncbi:MAG: AAA family ATPase [Alphaproteobacteria bacterium]|nr:AAA family ATPase [Alphaproteobacteria bacterium]